MTASALRLEVRTELDHYREYAEEMAQNPESYIRRVVTVRDYGHGVVEVGYSALSYGNKRRPKTTELDDLEYEVLPGETKNKLDDINLTRSIRRSKAQVRRKCMAAGLDHLLTLTYRRNHRSAKSTWSDWAKFARKVRRTQGSFCYVAVLEYQKRGACHIHAAVKGRQDVRTLRRLWLSIVGEGNIDVQGPRGGSGNIWELPKLASYLTKYISKEFASNNSRQRYRVSEGITIPENKVILEFPSGVDFVSEVFDSLGVKKSFHWEGEERAHGWACSWKT